jgi:hypothetical protein
VERAEPARRLRRHRQPGGADDAGAVDTPDAAFQQRVFDDLVRLTAPLVRPVDLVEADADPDRGGRFLARATAFESSPTTSILNWAVHERVPGAPFDIRTGITIDREPSRVRS